MGPCLWGTAPGLDQAGRLSTLAEPERDNREVMPVGDAHGGHGAHEGLRPSAMAGSDVTDALWRLGRLRCVATSREGPDLIGTARRLLSLLLLQAEASLVDRHDGRLTEP